MKQFRIWNNVLGWATFLAAALTYCLTVEPTASFWDCPEFILSGSILSTLTPAAINLSRKSTVHKSFGERI